MPIRAQLSEELVNSEYRDIILKQLKKSVEKRQSAMRVKAEDYLLALPNNRKLYDESKVNIKADLVSGLTNEGRAELNYRILIDYTCHNIESTTDNYPTGAYLCEQSNASMAVCEIARAMIDDLARTPSRAASKSTSRSRPPPTSPR